MPPLLDASDEIRDGHPVKAGVCQPSGRWKIGAVLLAIACVAQAVLWWIWWDDPTHFKISILFVWPAAIFSLLVWWIFFSRWSARIRYGSVVMGVAGSVGFFCFFRLERFDGDMTPTRITLRSTATAEKNAEKYLRQLDLKTPGDDPRLIVSNSDPLVATEAEWPGYRGTARNGIVSGFRIRKDWSEKPPRELWRHPVGRAWSSFAVVGGLAFTQEQRGNSEAVVAYSLSTGQQLWIHIDDAIFVASESQGGTGPRATPQFDGGNVYTLGATGLLNCLDARFGKRIWSANILLDAGLDGKSASNLVWGLAGSPVVEDDLVIVIPGGPNGNSVAAYDKRTGKRIWRGGDRPASYGSASVEKLTGERQILVPLGTGLAGYSLTDGHELWFFPWENGPKVNGTQAMRLSEDSLLFGCGYGVGSVRLDFQQEGNTWTVKRRWSSNRFRPKFNDFVFHQGYVYGLDDGTLTCVDVETGNVSWKSGRYGYGQLLLIDELLLILSEDGHVVLIPATPKRSTEIARFGALDSSGITWNHPVIVAGKLLVRNAHEAACFELD